MDIVLPAVALYAQLAFGVVLDQHEITILPAKVGTVPMANGAIGLLYETPECAASGSFTGDERGGTLYLEHVRTELWETDFGTTDRFKGSRPDGTPILVMPTS